METGEHIVPAPHQEADDRQPGQVRVMVVKPRNPGDKPTTAIELHGTGASWRRVMGKTALPQRGELGLQGAGRDSLERSALEAESVDTAYTKAIPATIEARNRFRLHGSPGGHPAGPLIPPEDGWSSKGSPDRVSLGHPATLGQRASSSANDDVQGCMKSSCPGTRSRSSALRPQGPREAEWAKRPADSATPTRAWGSWRASTAGRWRLRGGPGGGVHGWSAPKLPMGIPILPRINRRTMIRSLPSAPGSRLPAVRADTGLSEGASGAPPSSKCHTGQLIVPL